MRPIFIIKELLQYFNYINPLSFNLCSSQTEQRQACYIHAYAFMLGFPKQLPFLYGPDI